MAGIVNKVSYLENVSNIHFIDPESGLKRRTRNAFRSHFVYETETMCFRPQMMGNKATFQRIRIFLKPRIILHEFGLSSTRNQ